jgi:Cu(I)/Ag(I) efflux system membrane fusion protein
MVSLQFGKRVKSRNVLFGFLVVVAFLLGLLVRGGGDDRPQEATHVEADHQQATTWTCSMHPQIQLPKPGQCPICAMDLIPLENDAQDELGPRALVLSEAAAALAEIQTTPVARRFVTAEVRLIGKVDYDETRYRTISAWVPGRIDTLCVAYTGAVVRRGERMVSLYSPELYAAQTELLNALQVERELQASNNEVIRRTSAGTVHAARERLRLWGLTDEQVARIEKQRTPSHHLTIRSPLSGVVVHKNAMEGLYIQTGTRIYTVADLSHVWVTLAAYESDLVWLREGQTINFSVEALPGRTFSGTIVFIDPVLNEKTRSVMVRLDVDNGDGLLKPGMFVHAMADAELAADGRAQTAAGEGTPPLVIPASAPLITGKRAVVYVRLPGHEQPTFEGREIVLGPRAGDHYLVESGLQEGELVVVKGNFKIDSALQIQARPSMMNPTGGGPAPGHQHGGGAPGAGSTDHGETGSGDHVARFEAPDTFTEQLGEVLKSYFEIQAALAGDDDGTAAAAAERSARTLQAVDMSLLTGEAHMAWMKDHERRQKRVLDVAKASDIAGRRAAFQALSEALWPTLRRFGFHGHRTVRLFNCPMANSGAGADWIQLDQATANPYYGASMLRCGSQTDSITAMVHSAGGR